MNEKTTQSKKITVGLTLSWLFGVFFAIGGLAGIVSGEPIPGIVMLLMAAVLLPPFTKLVERKWNFHLSKGMKIVVIIIGFIIFGATTDTSNVSTTQKEQQSTQDQGTATETDTSEQMKEVQPKTETNKQVPTKKKTEPIPTSELKAEIPTEPIKETTSVPVPSVTVSQKNAVAKAKSYLGYSAFSYTGLIKQLEYEQFLHADAVYGADNSGADWNVQVVKKAQSYMEYSAFSRGSLIDQLKYEGFTQAQAEYGANSVGL